GLRDFCSDSGAPNVLRFSPASQGLYTHFLSRDRQHLNNYPKFVVGPCFASPLQARPEESGGAAQVRPTLNRAFLAATTLLLAASAAADSSPVAFQQDDRVIFRGNTFAERMRQFSYFETLLLERFPEKGLTFRNLGWSADEVDLRPRPLDFGDIHFHLEDKAA